MKQITEQLITGVFEQPSFKIIEKSAIVIFIAIIIFTIIKIFINRKKDK